MKLRNKKTGKIVDLSEDFTIIRNYLGSSILVRSTDKEEIYEYDSLAALNEEWADYEEPKEYWYFDSITGKILRTEDTDCSFDDRLKEIGNHFETEEEAEKVVENLRAWKRLKDKGFKFCGWYGGNRIIHFRITSLDEEGDCLPHFVDDDTANDLDLLFGGEE